MATPGKLPAILCLHGSGVNGAIFNMQTARLQRALSKTFDFVFVDGPVESAAGAGILPFFEGSEPFFRWKKTTDAILEKDMDPETRTHIDEVLKTRDDWIGVLGFSQGGRVAAGLIMEQEEAKRTGSGGSGVDFKFGVFTMTPALPMTKLAHRNDDELEVIKTPSLHVVGMEDSWYDSALTMYSDYFDNATATLIELDIGHRLPTAPEDTTKIANEILKMYKKTTGIRGKLN